MTTSEKIVGETKVCVVTGLQVAQVRNCGSTAMKGKRFFLAPKRLDWHMGSPRFLFLSRQGVKLTTHFHLRQNLYNVQSYLHSFICPPSLGLSGYDTNVIG